MPGRRGTGVPRCRGATGKGAATVIMNVCHDAQGSGGLDGERPHSARTPPAGAREMYESIPMKGGYTHLSAAHRDPGPPRSAPPAALPRPRPRRPRPGPCPPRRVDQRRYRRGGHPMTDRELYPPATPASDEERRPLTRALGIHDGWTAGDEVYGGREPRSARCPGLRPRHGRQDGSLRHDLRRRRHRIRRECSQERPGMHAHRPWPQGRPPPRPGPARRTR